MRSLNRSWTILRHAAISTYSNSFLDTAKGAAFSSLLSFFPVLTTLATVLVQANAEQVSQSIAKFLFEVVPPGTEDLVQYAFTLRGARPNWLIAGAALLSIWSASDVVVSLMGGFQAAYRTPETRGFWRQRWVAVLLVFSTIVPTVSAVGVQRKNRRLGAVLAGHPGDTGLLGDFRGILEPGSVQCDRRHYAGRGEYLALQVCTLRTQTLESCLAWRAGCNGIVERGYARLRLVCQKYGDLQHHVWQYRGGDSTADLDVLAESDCAFWLRLQR